MKQILLFISSVILNASDLVNDFLNMCILHVHMCLQVQADLLVCPVLLIDTVHLRGWWQAQENISETRSMLLYYSADRFCL